MNVLQRLRFLRSGFGDGVEKGGAALGKAAFLGLHLLACDLAEKKEPPKSAVTSAPAPKEAVDAKEAERARALERQKEIALVQLKRQVAVLLSQPSFDEALPKIKEGLALDPQHSDFLKFQSEVSETLSHRCCGTWLRYDFTQPGGPKSLHGVLYSENLGENYRHHPFRGRILLACDKKATSVRIRVPWEVPQASQAKLTYKLGEVNGTEMVKTDAAPFIYELPQPNKWFQKLAESEDLTLELKMPKRDGTSGEFTFKLGQAKKIVDEVSAACK